MDKLDREAYVKPAPVEVREQRCGPSEVHPCTAIAVDGSMEITLYARGPAA